MDGSRRCVLLKFGELALKGRNRPRFVRARAQPAPAHGRPRVARGAPPGRRVHRQRRRPRGRAGRALPAAARRERRAAGAALRARRHRGGRRRGRAAARAAGAHVRRAGDAPRQALPPALDRAGAAAGRRGAGAAGARGGPERRPTSSCSSRWTTRSCWCRSSACAGPAGCRSGRADGRWCCFGRARLAGRGLPDDEARAALRLPALLGAARSRARTRSTRPTRWSGKLDRFQGGSRLYVVTFGQAQRRLATAGAGRLQVLSQRRLMMRVGRRWASGSGPTRW